MAQPMPESVKVARVGFAVQGTIGGATFPIIMGRDEVIILMALAYWWRGTLAAGENRMELGLWRKSDVANDPAIVPYSDHTDMIWGTVSSSEMVAESLKNSDDDFVTFPWPMVLIRPPRLLARALIMTSPLVEARLYYHTREVSDIELAKLMVKDHP